MTRIITQAIALIILLAQPTAKAEENYAAVGAGMTTCGEYINFRRTNTAAIDLAFYSYAQGFISGMNSERLMANNRSVNLAMMTTRNSKAF